MCFDVRVDELEAMRRAGAVRAALARAPGQNLRMLDPRPLVHVRAVYGRAIAVTDTHVLHEWVRYGDWQCRWDEKWQVERVTAEDWVGEEFGD